MPTLRNISDLKHMAYIYISVLLHGLYVYIRISIYVYSVQYVYSMVARDGLSLPEFGPKIVS